MAKESLIRTIYLYIFALVGLVLLVIGSVNFVNMGLKAFIFTQADADYKYREIPKAPPYVEKLEAVSAEDNAEFTQEERQQIRGWLSDYEQWKDRQESFDYVTSSRHRDAARNLALILIGLPLYLFHWSIIRRETKKR